MDSVSCVLLMWQIGLFIHTVLCHGKHSLTGVWESVVLPRYIHAEVYTLSILHCVLCINLLNLFTVAEKFAKPRVLHGLTPILYSLPCFVGCYVSEMTSVLSGT